MAKKTSRVNGRNGESMWMADGELCFRTNNKVQRMPLTKLDSIAIMNVESARELVGASDYVPYGAWTNEMPSSGGKTLYLTATNNEACWVMEINKSQVPNAQDFVGLIDSSALENLGDDIPTKAITTPLGGLFVIGEIVCILGAVFVLYVFAQPVIAILLLAAACLMFFKAR